RHRRAIGRAAGAAPAGNPVPQRPEQQRHAGRWLPAHPRAEAWVVRGVRGRGHHGDRGQLWPARRVPVHRGRPGACGQRDHPAARRRLLLLDRRPRRAGAAADLPIAGFDALPERRRVCRGRRASGAGSRLSRRQLQAVWSFPLDLSHVSADQAAGLLQIARGVSYLPTVGSVSASLSAAAGAEALLVVSLSSGLVSVLPSFVATDAAVQRALSLMFVSLAVIGAVVVLLGARLVTEHRRGEFALMRARGASLGQGAAVAARGGVAAVVPAALLAGRAADLVTPGAPACLAMRLAHYILWLVLAV